MQFIYIECEEFLNFSVRKLFCWSTSHSECNIDVHVAQLHISKFREILFVKKTSVCVISSVVEFVELQNHVDVEQNLHNQNADEATAYSVICGTSLHETNLDWVAEVVLLLDLIFNCLHLCFCLKSNIKSINNYA